MIATVFRGFPACIFRPAASCRIIFMPSCTSAVRRDWTALGIASREYFTKAYSRPLTESGLIARSDPKHPNSPRQKYNWVADKITRQQNVVGFICLKSKTIPVYCIKII